MVRQFTEEERRRQKEAVDRHYAKYHNGIQEGVECNYYADCAQAEREEWAKTHVTS
jgi:hypothetical protein